VSFFRNILPKNKPILKLKTKKMKKFYLLAILILTINVSNGQWNSNTNVNLEVANQTASDLQTISTSDGKTWIAYYAETIGGYDMYAQLLDAAGNKLLGTNGVLVSNQPSGTATYVFNICRDANDNLYIGFQYEVSGNLIAVVAKVTTAGTLPWGGGTSLGQGLAPYPAVNAEGTIIVAWNNNSPSTIYIQKLNGSNGALIYGSPISVTVGSALTTRAQLVCHENGDYTAVFQKKGYGPSTTLYAQRYSTAGIAKWVAPIPLSSGIYTASYRQYSILESNNSVYYGYYASAGSSFASYIQKIKSDGTLPWGMNGSPFSTYGTNPSDPIQMTTSIAKYPNSKYVWSLCTYSDPGQSDYGVYIQKFDTASGAVMLNPLGKEVYPISAARDQACGKLTLVNDAPLFTSYEDITYKIFGTMLDTLGNFVWSGNRVEVSSSTTTMAVPKGRFGLTDAVNGQAVAVWYENRGSGYRIYAQNISSLGPLPITLGSFTGINKSETALLSWTTMFENNNKGFKIERSRDGINFSEVGFVLSKSINGNSAVALQYNYTDSKPFIEGTYYRLKQYDLDGNFTYSQIIYIRFNKTATVSVKGIYPIPAKNKLNINIVSEMTGSIVMVITDMSGKLIKQQPLAVHNGSNLLNIDISSLSPGSYNIRLLSGNNILYTQNWIKE